MDQKNVPIIVWHDNAQCYLVICMAVLFDHGLEKLCTPIIASLAYYNAQCYLDL